MNIPSSGPAVLTLRGSTGDIHTSWLASYGLVICVPRKYNHICTYVPSLVMNQMSWHESIDVSQLMPLSCY